MREAPDPLGLSPRNPVLQAVVGLVLSVPLAILLTSLWPRLERHGVATMLLVWSGLGARAAAHAWRTRPHGRALQNDRLRLRIVAGMATLAVCSLAGAGALLAF